MSTLLHPVGPQPPRVYWRRRAMVAAAIVIVVVLVALLIGKLTGDRGDAAPLAASPAASQIPNCADADLTVSLAASQASYPAGATPKFTATVVNRSDRRCTIDTSSSGYQLVVTSGKDRVFSSADCAATTAPTLQLLDRLSSQKIEVTWPRVRSAAGCPSGQPVPAAGSYRAQFTMAGASSDQVGFTLG